MYCVVSFIFIFCWLLLVVLMLGVDLVFDFFGLVFLICGGGGGVCNCEFVVVLWFWLVFDCLLGIVCLFIYKFFYCGLSGKCCGCLYLVLWFDCCC